MPFWVRVYSTFRTIARKIHIIFLSTKIRLLLHPPNEEQKSRRGQSVIIDRQPMCTAASINKEKACLRRMAGLTKCVAGTQMQPSIQRQLQPLKTASACALKLKHLPHKNLSQALFCQWLLTTFPIAESLTMCAIAIDDREQVFCQRLR